MDKFIKKSIAILWVFLIQFSLGRVAINEKLPINIKKGDEVSYMGAVIEYEPYKLWNEGGEGILKYNAKKIVHFATIAKYAVSVNHFFVIKVYLFII